jgi:ureidoglycolate hydrolase
MNPLLIEIFDCCEPGYRPQVDFGAWRVASLRLSPELAPERIEAVERHTETDEVFVLLQGKAVMVIAGDGGPAHELESITIQAGKLYNVKRNTWHTILLGHSALVLVVENRDTTAENTEFSLIPEDQRLRLLKMGQLVL